MATLDETTAVAVGDNGTILRTEDAGQTWAQIEGGRDYIFWAVSFADANVGTAVGAHRSFPPPPKTFVFRTEDGGFTWRSQTTNGFYGFYGVHMIDRLTAVAVGVQNVILRTEDGGETWQRVTETGRFQRLLAVTFTGPEHGIATGWWEYHRPEAYITVTNDGGRTWKPRDLDPQLNDTLVSVGCADELRCTASGLFLLQTSDGGETWPTVQRIGHAVGGLAFAGEDGLATGLTMDWRPAIWATTDGGSTWNSEEIPPDVQASRVAFFPDSSRAAVAVGWSGVILVTP